MKWSKVDQAKHMENTYRLFLRWGRSSLHALSELEVWKISVMHLNPDNYVVTRDYRLLLTDWFNPVSRGAHFANTNPYKSIEQHCMAAAGEKITKASFNRVWDTESWMYTMYFLLSNGIEPWDVSLWIANTNTSPCDSKKERLSLWWQRFGSRAGRQDMVKCIGQQEVHLFAHLYEYYGKQYDPSKWKQSELLLKVDQYVVERRGAGIEESPDVRCRHCKAVVCVFELNDHIDEVHCFGNSIHLFLRSLLKYFLHRKLLRTKQNSKKMWCPFVSTAWCGSVQFETKYLFWQHLKEEHSFTVADDQEKHILLSILRFSAGFNSIPVSACGQSIVLKAVWGGLLHHESNKNMFRKMHADGMRQYNAQVLEEVCKAFYSQVSLHSDHLRAVAAQHGSAGTSRQNQIVVE